MYVLIDIAANKAYLGSCLSCFYNVTKVRPRSLKLWLKYPDRAANKGFMLIDQVETIKSYKGGLYEGNAFYKKKYNVNE